MVQTDVVAVSLLTQPLHTERQQVLSIPLQNQRVGIRRANVKRSQEWPQDPVTIATADFGGGLSLFESSRIRS
jgi:hypothetical protein